jgi:hypothetical protein
VECRALCHHHHTALRRIRAQRLLIQGVDGARISQAHRRTTVDWNLAAIVIADVGSAQDEIEVAHPTEATVILTNQVIAMDHLPKTVAPIVNVVVVVTSAAAIERVAADANVKVVTDLHANQEALVNPESRGTMVAGVSAAHATMVVGHAMIDAAEAAAQQTMDARGGEMRRIKDRVTEIRRGDGRSVKSFLEEAELILTSPKHFLWALVTLLHCMAFGRHHDTPSTFGSRAKILGSIFCTEFLSLRMGIRHWNLAIGSPLLYYFCMFV